MVTKASRDTNEKYNSVVTFLTSSVNNLYGKMPRHFEDHNERQPPGLLMQLQNYPAINDNFSGKTDKL